MLNIISFLLIILASVVCLKSADIPNQLLDLGVLILAGHSFATLARHMRLPGVIGYVIAGIIMGPGGLGLLNTGITSDMTIIESVLFMIIIADMMRNTCKSVSMGDFIPASAAGALGTIIILVFGTGILAFAGIPHRQAILFGLYTATLSPLIIHAAIPRNNEQQPILAYTTGAFATVFILWSIAAALYDPESVQRLQTAIAPVLVGVTSLVTGIVWGLITEFALVRPGKNVHQLFSVAALFLAYPLAEPFGLDIVFLGAGFGIYSGVFSNRNLFPPGTAAIASIVIFTLFGARLSIEDTFMLGTSGWRTVGILVTILTLGRFAAGYITCRLPGRSGIGTPSFFLHTLPGPLALLMVLRFGPALSFSASSPDETPVDLAIIITTMLLFATLVPTFMSIQRYLTAFKASKLVK